VQARSAVSTGLWQQTVAADDPGGVGEGLARQRQRGRVEQHRSPLAEDADLGRSRHLLGPSLRLKSGSAVTSIAHALKTR